MAEPSRLSVAIDTAGELAGVALSQDGVLLAELTWRTARNHSRELLPALDWLLNRLGRGKDDIGALFVCTGPGSYAGLRVGLSTAKTLAYALDVPIVGVGRLEADALPVVGATEGRVVAVQAAGRAELAWAAYKRDDDGLRELVAPGLVPAADFAAQLDAGDIVCGDVALLSESILAALTQRGARLYTTPSSRVLAVATLGQQRLERGEVDNADTLVPLYLRAPAIGPQGPGRPA